MSVKRKIKRQSQKNIDEQLQGYINKMIKLGCLEEIKPGQYRLTPKGIRHAEWLTKNDPGQKSFFHRLMKTRKT